MSALRISSGASGRPRFGPCARQTDDMMQNAIACKRKAILNVDIFHRPVGFNFPPLNAVEVVLLTRRILREPVSPGGLHVTCLIHGAAHQRGWMSVPIPGEP